MNILVLGLDSLIACMAIGVIVDRRSRLPLAAFFGVADAVAFLVGSAIVWQLSSNVSEVMETGMLAVLGLYLVAVAGLTRAVAPLWPVWAVPWALSLDNLTYGLVGDPTAGWLLGQAGQQALSSALLALMGLLTGVLLSRAPGDAAWRCRQRSRRSRVGSRGGSHVGDRVIGSTVRRRSSAAIVSYSADPWTLVGGVPAMGSSPSSSSSISAAESRSTCTGGKGSQAYVASGCSPGASLASSATCAFVFSARLPAVAFRSGTATAERARRRARVYGRDLVRSRRWRSGVTLGRGSS